VAQQVQGGLVLLDLRETPDGRQEVVVSMVVVDVGNFADEILARRRFATRTGGPGGG